MKNLKKILALVLAFACAFTMFAVAGAADFTDKASIKNYEAVNTLVALNILKGRENGSFDPDATVTRAEMTKMIYVIWNGGKDDATAYESMTSTFSDVKDHWARGYINFCASNNIVAGMGDGTFAPDQTVTGQQAAKMLLVLMGYDDKNAGLTGPKWAQNTMSYAGLAGLFKDVEAPVEQGMPRQYAAQMVYNTLEANRVKWSTDNNAFDEITQWSGKDFVKETVGERYMNYTTITGILVEARNGDEKGFSILKAGNTNKYSFNKSTTADREEWNSNLWVETKYTTDLSEYLGQEVKVSYNADEFAKNRESVYGVYSTDNNTVVTTTANKIGDAKENGRIKIDGTKYKIDDNMRYYYSVEIDAHATDLTSNNYLLNDSKTYQLKDVFGGKTNSPYADYEPFVANTVKFVDYDKDGKFDIAIDYPMAVAEVSMVSSSTISVKDVHGVKMTTTAPKRDDVVAYDGIAKGDIVKITWDTFKDKVTFTKMETTDETIGSVRNGSNNQNEEFNISTGWVKRFSPDMTVNNATKTGAIGQNGIDTKLKSGDKATFVVIGGIAYYVDRTQSGTGNDVAVVVNTGTSGSGSAGGENVEAKLMFADGTTSIVNVESVIVNDSNTTKYDLDDSNLRTTLGTSGTDLQVLDFYLSGTSRSNKKYNTQLKKGDIAPALVTYSRSGNDYTLQLLDETENDAGYDDVMPNTKWDSSSSDAKVGGYNLLDDGTVFVVYGTSSVKRYTGSQAKKLKTTGNKPVKTIAYALAEKSNGVSRVRIAAVYANDKPSVSNVGNYAYLLDKSNSKTIDGTSYIILTAYTKNGEETLYYEENASATRDYDKGDVVDFSYTNSVITDNGAEYKVIDDVENKNNEATLAAITGWDRDDISILVDKEVKNGTTSRSVMTSKDVDTDDTTVLIVDTDGKVGVSVGKEGIQVADNPGKRNGKDYYQINAKVLYDAGNDYYDLIVVDSLNNWLDNDWTISEDNKGVCDKDGNVVGSGSTTPSDPDNRDQKRAQKTLDDAANGSGSATLTATEVYNVGELTVPAGVTMMLNVSAINAPNPTVPRAKLPDVTYNVHEDTGVVTITSDPISFRNIRGTDTSARLRITNGTANGAGEINLLGLGVVSIADVNGQTLKWDGTGWTK